MLTEKLTLNRCLADLEFQDFLVQTEILTRDPKFLISGKNFKTNLEIGKFRQLLADKPGYIISREELALKIYGRKHEDDLRNVTSLGNYIKTIPDRSIPLIHLPAIGWGFGIDKLKLTKSSLPLVYRMWLDLEQNIPEEQLTHALHGFVNQQLLLQTRRLLSNTTDNLLATRAQIKRIKLSHGKYQYKLTQAEEVQMNDYSPNYLRQEFQDWLAKPKVNLLKRKDPKPTPYIGNTQKGAVHQFIGLLEKYHGYILPNNFICQIIYQNEGLQDKVRLLTTEARKRLADPNYIYTAMRVGVGVGIDKLEISSSGLSVLFPLWNNQEKFVSRLYLQKRLSRDQIQIGFNNLRQVLDESNYKIEISRSQGYKLISTKKAAYAASLENLENLSVN